MLSCDGQLVAPAVESATTIHGQASTVTTQRPLFYSDDTTYPVTGRQQPQPRANVQEVLNNRFPRRELTADEILPATDRKERRNLDDG